MMPIDAVAPHHNSQLYRERKETPGIKPGVTFHATADHCLFPPRHVPPTPGLGIWGLAGPSWGVTPIGVTTRSYVGPYRW
jgi:hypothetical protein